MKYFVEVSRRINTTQLGKKVANKIFRKYHCSVISHDQLDEIRKETEAIVSDEILLNPRFKKMKVDTYESLLEDPGNLRILPFKYHIRLIPEKSTWEDKSAFVLTATPIYNDYTVETGGEL